MGLISVRPRFLQPRYLLEAALDLLFPPQCVGCATPGSVWCDSCSARLEPLGESVCAFCGRPLAWSGRICTDCSVDPPILRSRSYAWYRPPLDAAILYLKYRPERRLVNTMGHWLRDLWREAGWKADLVTAVPLSFARRRQRGYNQALLLASAVARDIGLPLDQAALSRSRETGTQVGLGPNERRANVAGAFDARREQVDGKAVIVVDDLYTTGATLQACAASLIDAGASRVYGLTVARAGHTDPGAT